MVNVLQNRNTLIVLAVFWLACSIAIFLIGPGRLVGALGLHNAYFAAFVLALLGGTSSISVSPFYSFVFVLAAGGADIGVLGLVGGIGLCLSDSFFYYLGYRSRILLSDYAQSHVDRLSGWLKRQSAWKAMLVVYAYIGLTPLPSDILMVALAVVRYPFRTFLPVVLLGDITLVMIIAAMARLGSGWFA